MLILTRSGSDKEMMLKLLQRCGDQQLKARIVEEKSKGGGDALKALNDWRDDLRKPLEE